MSGIKMCNFLDLNPLNFLPFEKREGEKKKEDLFLFLLLYIFGMEKKCRQPLETQS